MWVHVNYAWFRPEVTFLSGEKMEHVTGLLSIPPADSFVKVEKISWKCMQEVIDFYFILFYFFYFIFYFFLGVL